MSATQLLQQQRLVLNMKTQLAQAMALLDSMKYLPMRKWDPKGGGYWVSSFSEVRPSDTEDKYRIGGVERATPQAAGEAVVHMRQSNRLHAWIAENATGEVNYKIEFEQNSVAIVVYAPEADIRKLEQLVDDGVVVF